jgi:hypothetical protein
MIYNVLEQNTRKGWLDRLIDKMHRKGFHFWSYRMGLYELFRYCDRCKRYEKAVGEVWLPCSWQDKHELDILRGM